MVDLTKIEWREKHNVRNLIASDDAAVAILTELAAELLPGWNVSVGPGGAWGQTAAVSSPDAKWEEETGQGGYEYFLVRGMQGNGIQKPLKAHAVAEALLDAIRQQKK